MGYRVRRGGLLLWVTIGLGVAGSLAAGSAPKSDPGPVKASSVLDVTPETQARQDNPPTYQADNPRNNLHFSFSPSGARITPLSPSAGAWSLDLALGAFGHDAEATSPGTARLSASENHVDYAFEGVRQTFVNGESALEHGFTLAAPPDHRDPGSETRITLDLAVGGDLVPKRIPPSYFVDFADGGGKTVLRYGPVRATGADGSILEAKIKILPATDEEGPEVRIFVEAENPV
ncbi:MAG TPA: hypothetical protein VFW45_09890, partial [Candidatus Polarisedimenticolia bacterium]|nr:hypothetical protein [Candidatus Polarisedimenticolia bacterium]